MKVEERLLKYVSYWTTSDENNVPAIPSSECQWDLGRALEQEVRDMGLEQVALSENCYVYALLPATPGMEGKKAIGFIAHMDTATDFNGKDVKPQIIPNYDGEDVLLAGSGTWLKTSDFADLKTLKGRTLITTDGTSLLGADDKAGIAAILTAVEELKAEGTPHGDIWVGFTPDEEVGKGPAKFDLDYFKADYGYTLDGGYEGEICYENFNAAAARVTVKGVNVHPGSAKDIMVNAALIATEVAQLLPADQVPSKTEEREGFFHLCNMTGDVASAELNYIIRDHDFAKFEEKQALLRQIEAQMAEKYGEGVVTIEIRQSYRNMLEIIEKNMFIADLAREAIRDQGLEPVTCPVRGGTDGATLSYMGLPCPNLGTGGYAYHGPFEHITVEGMETAVKIIKYLATHPVDR